MSFTNMFFFSLLWCSLSVQQTVIVMTWQLILPLNVVNIFTVINKQKTFWTPLPPRALSSFLEASLPLVFYNYTYPSEEAADPDATLAHAHSTVTHPGTCLPHPRSPSLVIHAAPVYRHSVPNDYPGRQRDWQGWSWTSLQSLKSCWGFQRLR